MLVEDTTQIQNQETIVSSDDFFSGASAPVDTPASAPENQSTESATTTTTEASSTEPATSAAATETTPVAETDPWADLELDAEPATEAPVQVSDHARIVAEALGLESAPATAEELQAAIDSAVQSRVAVYSQDPIRNIQLELDLSDDQLVRLELVRSKSRFDTDETINNRLADIEAEGRIKTIADELRSERQQKLQGLVQQAQQQQREYQAALDEAKRETWAKLEAFKDPEGRPVPDNVRKVLHAYINSDKYIQDLLTQPLEWQIQQAAMLHPKLGERFRAMQEKVTKARGASEVIRELEHQTPVLGSGAVTVGGDRVVSSDDFFNN